MLSNAEHNKNECPNLYLFFFAHYETILTLLYSLYGLYNSVYIWGSQKTPEYRGGHCKTPEYRVREEKK